MGLLNVSRAFIKAKPVFKTVNPSIYGLFIHRWMRYVTMAPTILTGTKAIIKKEKSIPDFIGDIIGISVIASAVNHRLFLSGIRRAITRAHAISAERPSYKLLGLGATRRTWVTVNDKSLVDDRIVKDLTVIYHHANKAGKHIDVHLGHLSLVYRVSGKPFEDKIKFNSKGMLTEESKSILLDHVRSEISKNARVPWNHDHTISNARMSWAFDQSLENTNGYGSGPTRQIIAQSKVEFYHPKVTSSLHMYAPLLNKHQGLYIYKIYEGKQGGTPILILGNLIPRDENYQDRLHLNMIQEKDFETKFLTKVDHGTITRKYDGASAYFNSSGEIKLGHSFKVFSPRMSKETGHRIEYTYKVPELATNGTHVKSQGMGELQFWKYTTIGQVFNYLGFRGAERICWNYLPAASVGGILNSDATRPRNIFPEIRIYRIDKWNNENVNSLPFYQNRNLQQHLVKDLDQRFWKVVKTVSPRKIRSWEGLVGVPEGLSINDGYKVKWWADAFDWKITSVNLFLSEKGNIAGVIWFKSLESGKEFKLGANALGTADRVMDMHDNPNNYIDRVYKVIGRNGHEGRAAKVIEEHLDK